MPSEPVVVDAMLALAGVGPTDTVYDLGSGDGRIVITAARRHGARGVGIDLDPDLVTRSRRAADSAGVRRLVEFREGDFFTADLRPATVVTLYLLPELNLRLRPRLLAELRPGARVVSHEFDMGDWPPDASDSVLFTRVLLWTIPATAGGRWSAVVRTGADSSAWTLDLEQRYQTLTGFATPVGAAGADVERIPLERARVHGDSIVLEIPAPPSFGGRLTLLGRITGETMHGTALAPGGARVGTWAGGRG